MFNSYQGYPYSNYGGVPNYMQRAYNSQPQPMAQPQPQIQPQVQMPMEMPIQDIKFVNKAEAEAYIVYPNTKVMLIDKDGGIVYVKTGDNMGQSKTDYFRFEPINADGSPIKAQEPAPQIDFDNFVKKDQLKSLGFVTIDEHNKVLAELETIKKALSGNRPSAKPEITKGGQQ